MPQWPEDVPFLWGAATSSHQVEGNNFFNDWWAWEQAGKVKESSEPACDQYRLFREDIDLLSRLGHRAHRFSLEWSRFEPKENEWDEQAFRHYEEFFQALRVRGIEPVVTLHHFTNPLWFTEKGGWLRPEHVRYFLRYVDRVVQAYGRHVRFWITLNEPLIFLYHGYYAGLWPPGLNSYPDALKVLRHLIGAHLQAYQRIHRHYESVLQKPVWVSIANHMMRFTPCRPASFLDRWAVFLRDWFMNRLFFEASRTGFLFFPGVYCEFLSGKGALDFLGVNYYARDFIRFAGFFQGEAFGNICARDHHARQAGEINAMGWKVYPEGLYEMLRRLKRYRLPILICENGICTQDDLQRERFIRRHLDELVRAKREGVPVKGYLYWSFLDNFEWAHGFEPRFGIVEVDFKTQARKIRESAQVLSDCCRNIESGG